jgi:uncharacterized protein YkwD
MLDSSQRYLVIGRKERIQAMKHSLPVRISWLAGTLTILLALGACSTGQWSGVSSQQAGGTYSGHRSHAPASPTPISSAARATSSPISRPAASTPSVGGGTGSTAGSTAFEHQIAQSVFQAINADRAAAGLPALVWSDSLVDGAIAHSLLMSADDQLSHQLPQEPAIGVRISRDGVQWTWCGENIGETSNASSGGALELHRMMMAEQPPNDGHRQNILSTHFTLLGVAVVIDSVHHLWLTEDFAN